MESDKAASFLSSDSKYSKSSSVYALRGNIYQLKLLMLFVKIGCKHNLKFRLATELVDAEKFDDLVFQYENDKRDGIVHRFLQAKHKHDETKLITAKDILSDNDDDFSLQKYFKSYRKIRGNPQFKGDLKDFIICTNINLDYNSLVNAKIGTEVVTTDDIFFGEIQLDSGKIAARVRLTVDKDHELIDKLKRTSDVLTLARELSKFIRHGSKYNMNFSIIQSYQLALEQEKVFVLETKKNRAGKMISVGKFSQSFLGGDPQLSNKAKNLRQSLIPDLNKSGLSLQDQSPEFIFSKLPSDLNTGHTCEETSLPDDHVKDGEINNFLKKFVFAVNQPNEAELGEIISHEMREDSKFNLISGDLAFDSFQQQMIEWFKRKEGNWITNENAEEFFDSLERKFNTLASEGLTSAYFEKLKGLGVKYKETPKKLEDFINCSLSKQVLHVISTESTFLSAIKVQQTLELSEQFKNKGSFIFTQLSSLSSQENNDRLMKAFETPKYHNLLVIEFDNVISKDLVVALCAKLKRSLQMSDKKVILISEANDALVKSSKAKIGVQNFDEVNDEICFDDLTEESQKDILLREINFQEKKTNLVTLFGASRNDLTKLIDSTTLVKLIKNEGTKIGKNLRQLGDSRDFLVNRMFNQEVVLKKEKILSDINCSRMPDLFVISGTEFEDDENSKVFGSKDEKLVEAKFQELCNQNLGSNIHWLKDVGDDLIWFKSQGSISNIAKYRKSEATKDASRKGQDVSEEKLLKKFQTAIISGPAGMGKSTMMTDLSLKLSSKNPSLWVWRLDFNDYATVFDEIKKRRLTGNVDERLTVDFFLDSFLNCQEQTKLETMFERNLIKRMFELKGHIALFLDGFDEISPDYNELAIELLQTLKSTKVEKLFVATRSSLRQVLEEKLNVFAHTLVPFSEANQINFLKLFWAQKLPLVKTDQDSLDSRAKAVIAKFSLSISDKEKEFIGIPLQMRMVAEIFQDDFQLSDESDSQLSSQFDLVNLYENFLRKKFVDIYFDKKQGFKIVTSAHKRIADEAYKQFEDRLKILSLAALFQIDDLRHLLSLEELLKLNEAMRDIKELKFDEGVVEQIIEERPSFVHRTFAEYFVSIALVERLTLKPETVLGLIEGFVSNASPVFVSALMRLLKNKKVRIDEQTLLSYVTEKYMNYSNIIKMFLDIDYSDDFGKTSLHYAVESDSEETVDFLLDYKNDILENKILKHGSFKIKEYEISNLVKFVNKTDNEGKSALQYSSDKSENVIALKLLLKGANIECLDADRVKSLAASTVGSTIRAYTKEDYEYRHLQEMLYLRNQDFFSEESNQYYLQSRILSYFFLHGRTQVIKALMSSIKDANERKNILNAGDNHVTPLARVNSSPFLSDETRLEIIKYILDNGGGTFTLNSSSTEVDYLNILQSAISYGHLKTFEFFIGNISKGYYNYFFVAARGQQFKIMEYLLKNHAKEIKLFKKNTPLHLAVLCGASVKVLQYLLKRGEDVNARNEEGETPILLSVKKGRRLCIVKYLASNRADVNIEDYLGETPLSVAVDKNQLDIMEFLLSECSAKPSAQNTLLLKVAEYFKNPQKFDLDSKVSSGLPRLHHAIRTGDVEWSKFLIRKGADLSKTDMTRCTPMDWAVSVQNSAIVEMLLQYGALVDVVKCSHINSTCNTNIHGERISWLLNLLTKLFQSKNLMRDMKKYLFGEDNESRYADWGPYGSGYPDVFCTEFPALFILNCRNVQGSSLLHVAIDSNDEEAFNEIVKLNDQYILRKYAPVEEYSDYQPISINFKDSQGNTPLHLAALKGQSKIVENLLERGAIFNSKNLEGKSPQDLAKSRDHGEIVKTLRTYKNLFSAVYQGKDLKSIEEFVNKGALINVEDKNNKTLMHYAIESDQIDVVKFLLRKGASIAKFFQTPNQLKNKCSDLIQLIRTLFDDVQSEAPETIMKTLKIASKRFKIDLICILDVQDNLGNSLLHYAAEANCRETVKWLLEKGAMCNRRNKAHVLPSDLGYDTRVRQLIGSVSAMFSDEESIFEVKEKYGLKLILNCRDGLGMTFLHKNAELGKLKSVQWLIDNGADIKAEDIKGRTPRDLANAQGHKSVVEFLEKFS